MMDTKKKKKPVKKAASRIAVLLCSFSQDICLCELVIPAQFGSKFQVEMKLNISTSTTAIIFEWILCETTKKLLFSSPNYK